MIDETDIAHQVADELFDRHGEVFGTDLETYRGHAQRVIGLVGLQGGVTEDNARALGIAGFFHDAAIWFDKTWDYLPPSTARALDELGPDASPEERSLVEGLIGEHHRLRKARHADPLVEAFRRADATDVYMGLAPSPGVSRGDYKALLAQWPAKGFRPMLVRAFGHGLRQNPLKPMPMIKL